MKHLLFLLLPAVLLAGCSKGEPDAGAGPGRGGAIRIASAIEASAETRAVVTDGDQLADVQFLRVDVANDGAFPAACFTGVAPVAGTRMNTNAKPVVFDAPVPEYNTDDSRAYFVAYHPKTTVASEVAAWTIDGKTDILVTPVWDAGKYSAPKTGAGGAAGDPMLFRHQLAQLEVICKAYTADGMPESTVQALWGDITSIELLNTASEATYAYATNTVAFGGAGAGIALLDGATYADAFAAKPVTVNDANAVTAAGMFAPDVTPGSTAKLQLRIRTTEVPAGVKLQVQLRDGGADAGFTRGRKHTVTLSLRADPREIAVTGTAITPWGTGYGGGNAVEFPTPPVVGDYYYSDGTTSTALNASKTAEGIVFWVDPDNPWHYKVVSKNEEHKVWGPSPSDFSGTDYAGIRVAEANINDLTAAGRLNGRTNREIVGRWIADGSVNTTGKTIADFPAFKYCDDVGGGNGWYLPAINELHYLLCAWNGGAPTTWGANAQVPYYDNSARTAFNARLTTAGGTALEFSSSSRFWSSSESDDDKCWVVLGDGKTESHAKTWEYPTRCIKEIN